LSSACFVYREYGNPLCAASISSPFGCSSPSPTTRSLTRAAEREHLALAAVSKRVSDLEGQLGVSLLYRQPKGVELTPAGHALLHHARNLLETCNSWTPT